MMSGTAPLRGRVGSGPWPAGARVSPPKSCRLAAGAAVCCVASGSPVCCSSSGTDGARVTRRRNASDSARVIQSFLGRERSIHGGEGIACALDTHPPRSAP